MVLALSLLALSRMSAISGRFWSFSAHIRSMVMEMGPSKLAPVESLAIDQVGKPGLGLGYRRPLELRAEYLGARTGAS